MGIDALRLDEGFTGYEEAILTHNPYGIKIELNISRGQDYIDMVTDFGPNKSQLVGSHNFYPQAYTGLTLDYFLATAQQYKRHNLQTAAFIDSPNGQVGPWPISDRIVSAEVQRIMSLSAQVFLLRMAGLIT
nr:MupG family TIM beta-alpha barrel fold protein [Streptococcus catagoni]